MIEPDYGISFVIPCYNEAKNIVACIWSIQKDMRTSLPAIPFEIIVADNGSTDNSVKLALCIVETRIVHETRKGVVHARNAGTKAARYCYVANIDADNQLPIGWTKAALDALSEPNVVAVSGPLVYHDERLINLGAKVFYFLARFFHQYWPTIQGGNYMIKKEAWTKIKGYNTEFAFYGEDTSTAKDFSAVGRIKLVPKMWIWSSPRRIRQQGLLKTIWLYTSNYFWVSWYGKPRSNEYRDFR